MDGEGCGHSEDTAWPGSEIAQYKLKKLPVHLLAEEAVPDGSSQRTCMSA